MSKGTARDDLKRDASRGEDELITMGMLCWTRCRVTSKSTGVRNRGAVHLPLVVNVENQSRWLAGTRRASRLV